jgi:hypothetical protein
MNRSRVRTGSTTSGHRRSSSAADPDARRARGPHSLAEVSTSRLLELIRYSSHRSNLDASTRAVTRRCIRCVSGLRIVGCGGLAVDASRGHGKRFGLHQYRPGHAGVPRSDRDKCLPIAHPFGQSRRPAADAVGLVLGCIQDGATNFGSTLGRTRSGLPAVLTPCTVNTFFARSMPTTTIAMDFPFRVS